MKTNKKIITAAIAAIITTSLAANVLASQSPEAVAGWLVKRGLYSVLSIEISRRGMEFLTENLDKLILLNPDPKSEEIQNVIKPIMEFLLPLYLLSIVAVGFYLLFISGSPSGRAKAKKAIVHLIIGMIAVSFSTQIISLFISFSTKITETILYTSVGWKTMAENIKATFGGYTGGLYTIHSILTLVEIELGYFTMLPYLLFIWGAQAIFFLRYAAVTLWVILFPLSVALYSFQTTRDIGRNMLEQTIMWTTLQEFFATIVIAVGLCLMQKPADYMSPPIPAPQLPSVVVFDFIPFIGCFVMLIAPLFVLRIFRSFLP